MAKAKTTDVDSTLDIPDTYATGKHLGARHVYDHRSGREIMEGSTEIVTFHDEIPEETAIEMLDETYIRDGGDFVCKGHLAVRRRMSEVGSNNFTIGSEPFRDEGAAVGRRYAALNKRLQTR